MTPFLKTASIKLVLEYRDHFHDTLHNHGGKCPETGNPSLRHVKDKSAFFKDLKASWAAKKLIKAQAKP